MRTESNQVLPVTGPKPHTRVRARCGGSSLIVRKAFEPSSRQTAFPEDPPKSKCRKCRTKRSRQANRGVDWAPHKFGRQNRAQSSDQLKVKDPSPHTRQCAGFPVGADQNPSQPRFGATKGERR